MAGDLTATAFGHIFALDDALGEILEGDWSLAKACAYIKIALTLAQHHIWGTPLPSMRTLMGTPSGFALALHIFETGEAIVKDLPQASLAALAKWGVGEEEIAAEEPAAEEEPEKNVLQRAWDWIKNAGTEVVKFVVSAAQAIDRGIKAAGKWVQDKIDVAGEYWFGNKWTEFREWCNFENPIIQGAIIVASFVIPGAAYGRAAAWIGRAFARVGMGLLRGLVSVAKVAGNALKLAGRGLGRLSAALGPRGGFVRLGGWGRGTTGLLGGKKPLMNVTPGIKSTTGVSLGGNKWIAHYDTFGRLSVEEHFAFRGSSAAHGIHHHVWRYNDTFPFGIRSGHIPGRYEGLKPWYWFL
ncbi:hypothetical protein JW859_05850 [bacterium]|nr:hypothetical protein [bacterium]